MAPLFIRPVLLRGVTVLAGIWLLITSTVPAQMSGFRIVALTDDPALSGDAFSEFMAPTINETGQVAFRSTLQTGETEFVTGTFVEMNGILRPVFRSRDRAPGTPSFIASPGQPFLNQAGQIALGANLQGGDVHPFLTNNSALYAGPIDRPTLIAREGSPAPDTTPGTVFRSLSTSSPFGNLLFNQAGEVAFTALLSGPDVNFLNGIGLFAGAPGSVRLITRGGQLSPGAGTVLPADTILGPSYSSGAYPVLAPVFNDAGQVFFCQELRHTDQQTSRGLFLGSPEKIELIAASGLPAPDMPAGVVHGFEPGFNLAVNAAGQIAFAGTLAGEGITFENDDVLYAGRPGELRKVMQENDPAPETSAGVQFAEFSAARALVLNNQGQVVFQAFLKGEGVNGFNHEALYTGNVAQLPLVARTGDPAPQTEAGTFFHHFYGASLNDRGEAAFIASWRGDPITNSPVTSANDFGLFGYHPETGPVLLLREGDVLEVTPGDWRKVQSIAFNSSSAGHDGRMRGLNGQGRLTFAVRFSDSKSAVLVTTQSILGFAPATPSSPRNISVTRDGANMRVTWRGTPGAEYRVEVSSNLIHWRTLVLRAAPRFSGIFELIESIPANSDQQFFRAVYP
ncbi:MAG: choice-of-anchor tandem repeat NxxGxxAF-containing protein [Verrucomicrobiota bacterium]